MPTFVAARHIAMMDIVKRRQQPLILLRSQLLPLIQTLEDEGLASFHFERAPLEGVQENLSESLEQTIGFMPEPPHYRWTDFSKALIPTRESIHAALNHLDQNVVRDQGSFDGILGFSEGAVVAAHMLLRKAESQATAGEGEETSGSNTAEALKCAVFLHGLPPVNQDSSDFEAAGNLGGALKVPTCHVIGSKDPTAPRALDLYEMCDERSAQLVQHSKGHYAPYDRRTLDKLEGAMREMIASVDHSEERS
ncbi:MAG: hypothetical protein M1831_001166 [Alyxoria varia]|nr:MAG: hypothetical protein M1831_001166 [Alyxoria varia]